MFQLSANSKPTGYCHVPTEEFAPVSSASFKLCHPIHVGNGGDDMWKNCDLACGRADGDDELKGQVVMKEILCADPVGPKQSHLLFSHEGGCTAAAPTLHRIQQTFGMSQKNADKVLYSNEFIIAATPVIAADMRKGIN